MANELAELRQNLAPSPTSELSRRRGTGTSVSSDAEDFEDLSVAARRCLGALGRSVWCEGTSGCFAFDYFLFFVFGILWRFVCFRSHPSYCASEGTAQD